jgi:hypothetical protein
MGSFGIDVRKVPIADMLPGNFIKPTPMLFAIFCGKG